MKSIIKKLLLLIVPAVCLCVGFFAFSGVASAQGLDLGLKPLSATGLATTDIRTIIANIIRVALGLLGIGALCLMIYAGYEWMTAGGNEEQITTAKKILINATIGLVIILSAYSIVSFVINKLTEATGNGSNECGGLNQPPCGQCDDPYNCPLSGLYVKDLPTQGNMCIRNIKPVVVFSRPVDLGTIVGRLMVLPHGGECDPATRFPGVWSYSTGEHNIIVFTPSSTCPSPDTGTDCFASSTTYDLRFCYPSLITDTDGGSLHCEFGKGCPVTNFTTGSGVDRTPPSHIGIDNIQDGDLIAQDSKKDVYVSFLDDVGVQMISLKADDNQVGQADFQGCSSSSGKYITWNTAGYATGTHYLQATGFDFAGYTATSSRKSVLIVPPHCVDKIRNFGETDIDCGADCPQCNGLQCTADTDCVSGYCYKNPSSSPTGICLPKMQIRDISPIPAAHGDYLSILGKYFGDSPGHVYFQNSATTETEAKIVSCGPGFDNWAQNQIIVEVPNDAISGYIHVVTASSTGPDGVVRQWEDFTGTNGWKIPHAPDFVLTSTIHPGICGIRPDAGEVGTTTAVYGKNFGATKGITDYFKFYETKANTVSWASTTVSGTVPLTLGNGDIGVTIVKDGVSSNSILFNVFGASSNGPIITGLSVTTSVAFGDYLTIYGKNFGNTQYNVWFSRYSGTTEIKGSKVKANTNFPKICQGQVWSDQQIIVKIPDLSSVTSYAVRVERPDFSDPNVWLESPLDPEMSVAFNTGDPAPGICDIKPKSAPVPGTVTISGEHFTNSTKAYFSTVASSDQSNLSTFASSSVSNIKDINDESGGGQTLDASSTVNTVSGKVFLVAGSKKSNSLNFKVYDCTSKENNNTCAAGLTCCTGGTKVGSCIDAKNDFCGDERKASGYMWMFSPNRLVANPQVVERCGVETENPPPQTNPLLPSPSPSTLWGGQSGKVCHTALPTVEFSAMMSSTLLNTDNVQVYSCGTGDSFDQNNCNSPVSVSIDSEVANIDHSYIQITPHITPDKRWTPNTWYQIKLTTDILTDTSTHPLALMVSDLHSCGGNSAYCFNFKTSNLPAGQDDCKLRSVVVTPSSFWTSIIDEVIPVKVRGVGFAPYDLVYQSNGLSSQYCTLMNVADLDWVWSSASTTLANTTTIGSVLRKNQTKALAFKNTVDVGIAGDAVNIQATFKPPTGGCAYDDSVHCSTYSDCNYRAWYHGLIMKKNGFCIGTDAQGFGAGYDPQNGHLPNGLIKAIDCNSNADCTNSGNSGYLSFLSNGNLNATCYFPDQHSIFHDSSACNSSAAKTGTSPLTIDLSHPEIVDYAPNCLEACTNATVWAKFNTTMSNNNVSNNSAAVKISKCNDENCQSLTQITSSNVRFEDDHLTLDIFGAGQYDYLDTDSLYLVQLSASTTPGQDNGTQLWSGNGSDKIKPYNKSFSWRFRTKKTACIPAKVDVLPKIFTAHKLNDKALYQANPLSAPDACSATGQKINPWKLNWHWTSSDTSVAAVKELSTIGHNPFCNDKCLKNGSTVPYTSNLSPIYPICGNGKIEAGEDCDSPVSSTCQLNCLHYPSQRKSGSKPSTASTAVNTSICGNGMVGLDEDCDLGIFPLPSMTTSSFLCSANCLHMGTRLSKAWCANPASTTASNFSADDIKKYCDLAYSQCGDGVLSPDEDPGCDGPGITSLPDNCNSRCLKTSGQCTPGTVGCSDGGLYQGSSLLYNDINGNAAPSICGDNVHNTNDGIHAIGEDPSCDALSYSMLFGHSFVDPWALVVGQGLSANSTGTPPVQESIITAKINTTTYNISGTGKYQVPCGFASDQECNSFSQGSGVGTDSCCYARPKLIGVYPGTTSSPANNVCINTYIEAYFDSNIDAATLPGNLLLARGISAGDYCPAGTTDVTSFSAVLGNQKNLAWYEKIWQKIVAFVRNIFVDKATADTYKWCAGLDVGKPSVLSFANGTSKIVLTLSKPLAKSTPYAVILKNDIKNVHGVSIAQWAGNKNPTWQFNTGDHICTVDSVTIDPPQASFSVPNTSTLFVASAHAKEFLNGQPQTIVSMSGYSWEYLWGPTVNSYVSFASGTVATTTVTSKNRDGELDIFASAYVMSDLYENPPQSGVVATGKSHIIVFLCENPWPPKPYSLNNSTPDQTIFPYEDKYGNNDDFDLTTNTFNGSYIKPSVVYKGGYFNFKTYYCADNGDVGAADDLPYLRPAVQTSTQVLGTVQTQGICDGSQTDCSSDSDCTLHEFDSTKGLVIHPFALIDLYNGKIDLNPKQIGICEMTDASTNFSMPYFSNNQPFKCGSDSDCEGLKQLAFFKSNSYNYNFNGVACKSITNFPFKTIKKPCSIPAISALKRFLFTNDKNSDAIGIQIFDNPNHLPAKTWLDSQKYNSDNFQQLSLDGYNALSDGENVYVDALNFVPDVPTQPTFGNLSNNIYLFSISKNYKPETKKVFDELIKNTTFNANLSNYGYCGTDINSVDAANQVACKSDFDCPTHGVCQSTPLSVNVCAHNNAVQCTDSSVATDCASSKQSVPGVCTPVATPAHVCSNEPTKACTTAGQCKSITVAGHTFTPSTTYVNGVENMVNGGFCGMQDSWPIGGPYPQYYYLDTSFKPIECTAGIDGGVATECYDAFTTSGVWVSGQYFPGTFDSPFKKWHDSIVTAHPGAQVKCIAYSSLPQPTCDVTSTVFSTCSNNTTKICTNSNQCPVFSVDDTCVPISISTTTCSNNSAHCNTDFDCQVHEVCAVQTDKLKRDYQRLEDMSAIDKSMNDYFATHNNTYPALKSGTYLTGQTISTWPSWSALGGLPQDPINKLGVSGTCASSTNVFCTNDANCVPPATTAPQKCVLHAPDTGWSTADRRFSFACSPESLAYRYITTSTVSTTPTADYQLRFRFEDIGLAIMNDGEFFNYFIPPADQSHFNIPLLNSNGTGWGICNQDQEITTLSQGYCGDGQVNLNLGEQCDPVGIKKYHTQECTAAHDWMTAEVCGTDCHWHDAPYGTYLTQNQYPCSVLTKCGNGIVEAGEACDDGAQNGKYNHCDLSCTGIANFCGDGNVSSTYEVCETKNIAASSHNGWCVGGFGFGTDLYFNNAFNAPNFFSPTLPVIQYCTTDADCEVDTSGNHTVTSSIARCVTLDNNKNRYGGNDKTDSCNFDCQKRGPYCGDGIVQPEFGEDCDKAKDNSCSIDGQPGERVCNDRCRWENDSAQAYYDFNNVFINFYKDSGDSSILNIASSSVSSYWAAMDCTGANCPHPDPNGHIGQAMSFNGVDQYFQASFYGIFDLNEITISSWIKVPSTTSDGWHAILSKQANNAGPTERDYNFYVYTYQGKVVNLYFTSESSAGLIFGDGWALPQTNTSSIFATNTWTFVAVTVDAHRNGKFYLNDPAQQNVVQLGSTFTNGNPTLHATNNYPVFIGRADNFFKGSIDELQLYNRPLSVNELNDLYQHNNNFCQKKTITPDVYVPPIVCGNAKVETNEDCDLGDSTHPPYQNGVTCTPGLFTGCWYCTGQCKRVNISPLI